MRVPSHVSRDDLTSAGTMALLTSARSYDASLGVPFARFAAIRIRGALVDELRGMDWASRSARTRAKEVDAVRAELASTLGRTPRPEDVAAAMGVSVSELDGIDHDVARATVLSLQGFAPESGPEVVPDATAGPEALLLNRERIGYLHDAIAELPERQRAVVMGYFFQQRRMLDIAEDLGVTESRVSQLRSEALKMLKAGLDSQLEASQQSAPAPTGVSPAAKAKLAAYVAALASRSTLAGRLAATSVLGEPSAAFGETAAMSGGLRIA